MNEMHDLWRDNKSYGESQAKHREKGYWRGWRRSWKASRIRCSLSRNWTMKKRVPQLYQGTMRMCSDSSRTRGRPSQLKQSEQEGSGQKWGRRGCGAQILQTLAGHCKGFGFCPGWDRSPWKVPSRGGTWCDICFQSVPLTAVSKRRPRGWTQRNAETFKEAAAFTRVTGDGGSDLRTAGENWYSSGKDR